METIKRLEKESATPTEKLWAVETLVSALEDPSPFDQGYDVLADEEFELLARNEEVVLRLINRVKMVTFSPGTMPNPL